ncbi:ATP-dependent DNA helicase RecG [Candidatus Gottesmanbacteria bacterium]|nr:ATP-dependent DNA helicase RecG [Candidatus Gottesmanbacteria bacterium]
MNSIRLDTPVQYLKLVGPLMAGRLTKLGIENIDDLLHHIPFRYEDYRIVSKIGNLQEGETVTVQGKVDEIKNIYTKTGKKIQEATISDYTGELKVTWYNQPFLINTIKIGVTISLSGKTKRFGNKIVMDSPSYELIKLQATNYQLPTIHTARLVPIYPETEGISSKWLRSRIYAALSELSNNIVDFLPEEIIKKYSLFKEKDALWQIHFPHSPEHAEHARKRLAFDELFLIQLSSFIRKKDWKKEKVASKFEIDKFLKKIDQFILGLPFRLTSDQKKAYQEIIADLKKDTPMNRLLQGEVGSGKTVVSAIAIYLAHLNGFQVVFMAPTEILVNQHYQTLSFLLAPIGIKVGLFTQRQKEYEADIIVGTHAVLRDSLSMKNLGLVVIDEQQRFGVAQRALLRQKSQNPPHLLTMTATPIPRTMALTLYGELDVSFIKELPKERKRVKTWVVPPEKRPNAYDWIKKNLSKDKAQAFIICPFIDESESIKTVKAAKTEFERLKRDIFPDFSVDLLHGKLKSKDRENVLARFKEGKTDILVATPIVEVGIDITNATIILIEAADRFGLTQLHQLRGRVGRGKKQGYCLLFTEAESESTVSRLKVLETTFIGSVVAEKDLEKRGPGDIYGLKQHGFTDSRLKVANLSDSDLLKTTKIEAQHFAGKDFSQYSSPLLRALKKYTIANVSSD